MWQDTASGCVGAIFCTGAGLPFDVVKSKLQHSPGVYRGVVDCMVHSVRHGGVAALYAGTLPALSSALAENSVGITVQRTLRRQLAALSSTCPEARYSLQTEMALGGVTGIFTAIAICPFEVLKVRQQVSSAPSTLGGWLSELRGLLHAEGPAGLYRGFGSLVLRDVPFNALFYGTYESLCTLLMQMRGAASKEELGPLAIMGAGGFAGSIGWSAILPFDYTATSENGSVITEAGIGRLSRNVLSAVGTGR